MKIELILNIISLIISGFLGFFIKWLLDKRNEKETRTFERKEERYKKLLQLSIQLYREKDLNKLGKIKSELMYEYDFSWLYASDNVILKFDKFIESLRKETINSDDSMSLLAEAILQMRKDLGIKSKLISRDWKPMNPEK